MRGFIHNSYSSSFVLRTLPIYDYSVTVIKTKLNQNSYLGTYIYVNFFWSTFSIVYVLVSAALTLMVPYSQINPNAALPEAFSNVGLHWVSYIVILGAICGMTTSLLGSLFSLPRCLYAMAEDGLIFKFFADVDKRTQVRQYVCLSSICGKRMWRNVIIW